MLQNKLEVVHRRYWLCFISFVLGKRTYHPNGKCLSVYISTSFRKGEEKRIGAVKKKFNLYNSWCFPLKMYFCNRQRMFLSAALE